MKILFVSEYFWPRAAGGEVWAFELCEALAAKGHDVTVLTQRHDKALQREEMVSGVRIRRLADTTPNASSRLRRWLKLRTFVRLARREVADVDVVHVMAYGLNVPISKAAAQRGIPCVTSIHAYFGEHWAQMVRNHRALWHMEKQRIRKDRSQKIHVPSRYLQERILRDTGRESVVIHNWQPGAFPKPRKLPKDTYLFVGSLEPVKNPLACIPAAQGKRLVVIGTGSLLTRMRADAERAGLDCTFIRECSREDVLSYLGGASLLLVPSHTESFSLTALEAVAQGTPVSGNPVGILPELPGIVPFPPAGTPKRLSKTVVSQVRHAFTRERAVEEMLRLYREAGA